MMGDQPSARELVKLVAVFLRNVAIPSLSGAASYQARVAANALDVVLRETAAERDDDEAVVRLRAILGAEGERHELELLLCQRIADGRLGRGTPGLAEHLWAVTMSKLAVDQPSYGSYRAELLHATRGAGTR